MDQLLTYIYEDPDEVDLLRGCGFRYFERIAPLMIDPMFRRLDQYTIDHIKKVVDEYKKYHTKPINSIYTIDSYTTSTELIKLSLGAKLKCKSYYKYTFKNKHELNRFKITFNKVFEDMVKVTGEFALGIEYNILREES